MERVEYASFGGMPIWGCRLLNYVLDELETVSTVLNVGVKHGIHSCLFMYEGHKVIGVSPMTPNVEHELFTYIEGMLEDIDPPLISDVDVVWASMVLEHAQNVGDLLTKCRECLKPNGWFGVVVPSDKTDLLVDGHLSFWTPASLIYNMVMAGWDCKDARWYTQGRDIGLMVQRVDRPSVELDYDRGDLEKLQPYFPVPFEHRKTDPWLEDNI